MAEGDIQEMGVTESKHNERLSCWRLTGAKRTAMP